ncbi:MAG TPA: molybdopterin dinucleotide binding domain-containing protein, partial [Methylomirabilota bacterium]|nr:molybdopterin dinucleotide binding domain-containing protein [Methylomirabilota bacterium]
VVLPGSLAEEDDGTVTTGEARVVRVRRAVSPPGQARRDWEIVVDLARRLGKGEFFPYGAPADIFRELAAASAGGVVDYSGITYERLEQGHGVFWPCPAPDHGGTPRLFEDGRFAFPDGRARFHAVTYRPPAEDADEAYPLLLTTGRVVAHYLSGNQTRRLAPLVEQCPHPYVEMHPTLAARLGVAEGRPVRVVSRRGEVVLPARVVATIRPDTVFVPYHWPGEQSINRVTHRALDPVSRIPEFKVCAVRVEPA